MSSEYFSEAWMFPPNPYGLRARFECQPPPELRKSNFFNFRIELRTEHGGGLLDVLDAKFQHYLNEGQMGDPRLRNGIKYSVTLKFPNETTEKKDLYLMLVDAATREPIQYEGHDDNPKMKRVLLTHETICTRCSLNKSCGNKNEAPSDPGIASRGLLKFFLKCNQNCLKGAGNPRDMRRFSLAVSFDDMTFDKRKILALSDPIFVHNNSKHSRKRRKEEGLERMRIFHLSPCGEKVTVVGENFRPGTRLFINNEAAPTAHVSDHVIEAWVPPVHSSASFKVTLQHDHQFLDAGYCSNEGFSGPLACVSPVVGRPDSELHFVSRRWSVPGVLFMCGNVHLPLLGIVRNTASKVLLPYNVPSGFQTITVLWNNRVQFTFPYLIQERRREPRPHEYLCLHRKGIAPCQAECERRNVCVCVEECGVGLPFDRAAEWTHYFRTLAFYESGRSYPPSSPEAILHTSGSEHSSPL